MVYLDVNETLAWQQAIVSCWNGVLPLLLRIIEDFKKTHNPERVCFGEHRKPVSVRCRGFSTCCSDGNATTGFFPLWHVVADVTDLQPFENL